MQFSRIDLKRKEGGAGYPPYNYTMKGMKQSIETSAPRNMKRVAVVGAGVIGSSTALHLNESLRNKCEITLISEHFSPNTTSDKSSGAILPFEVTRDPVSDSVEGIGDIGRWSKDTIEHMHTLFNSCNASKVGLTHVYGCDGVKEENAEAPWWANHAHGFRRVVDKEERKAFNIPEDCGTVFFFGTYVIDCRMYLPWMMEQFKKNGGTIVQKKVSNLSELYSSYDVIINCTGLGAFSLVNDTNLFPISGEAASFAAPWIKNFIILPPGEDGVFPVVYPRAFDVVCGGTSNCNDWSSKVDPSSSSSVVESCKAAFPSLMNAELLSTWVGLRPARQQIRLTCDQSSDKPALIHCYGHGSKGVSLHWGCALEIGRLVNKIVNN